MKTLNRLFLGAAIASAMFVPMLKPANAVLLTATPGTGTTYNFTFSGTRVNGTGPVDIGGFATQTSTATSSRGSTSFGLASNGNWSGLNSIGLESNSGSLIFRFNSAQSTVGGLMNYARGAYNDVILSALDQSGNVLESYNITQQAGIVTTGTNQGAFRGISRNTADIYSLQVSNAYVIMSNLSYSSAAVPEPCSTLAGVALLGGFSALRRRRSSNAQ